jgi:prephenate dehydratase
MGAIGGPHTFGGDAANEMMRIYPEFNKIVYFVTAEEGMAFTGGNDAMCAPQQMARTGFHPRQQHMIAAPDSKTYIICDITHVYHCSFLLKPGAKMSDVREVRGHTGSITQSRPWLEKHVPQAKIHIVHTSSHEAAREVSLGDGTIASVGTPGMAKEFGLVEAAKEIDGGSSANYWALSPHALFADAPNRLVIAGRFADEGTIGRIIGAIGENGYHLQAVYNEPTGLRLYEYDWVLRFGGKGRLSDVKDAVGSFPGARLAGAYQVRD